MARVESTRLHTGTKTPWFERQDTIWPVKLNLDDVQGPRGTLVYFIWNHCPYVIYTIDELVDVAMNYEDKGVGAVAISSNDVDNYPLDSPDNMEAFAMKNLFSFPYLYDEDQSVAKAYAAACTPDIYLFDGEDKLYYRGRLDANRPGSGLGSDGKDLRAAIELMLAGAPAPEKQYPSAGCNIKWK